MKYSFLPWSFSFDVWILGILLYEMLYGRTPFKGKNRRKTFANILFKDLTFPFSIQVSSYIFLPLLPKRSFFFHFLRSCPISSSSLNSVARHKSWMSSFNATAGSCLMWQASFAAKQLIDALLQRDPARRLGSSTGADEIKRHPFFHQIDWPKIRTMVT